MENTITADLLKRFFAGACTVAEETLVESWIKSNPENAKQAMQWIEQPQEEDELFAQLMNSQDEVWEKTSAKLPDLAAITEEQLIQNQKNATRIRNRKIKSYWLQLAAVLAGLLIVAFAVHLYWKRTLITVETTYGQVQTITLPDSSVVQLNGNSKIAYKRAWQIQGREVWLDGEAFFTITHAKNHQKFTVHLSGQMDIEVLGTEFNVFDRTSGKSVMLKSGKIKLNYQDKDDKAEKNILLKPGELIETEGNTSGIHKKTVLNPQMYYAWTSRKWLLDGTTLAEMLQRLKETYGINIVVEDKALLNKRASGSIPLPLENATNAFVLVTDIANLFELKIHTRKDVIYLESIQ